MENVINNLKEYKEYLNVLEKLQIEIENPIKIYNINKKDVLVTGNPEETHCVLDKDGKLTYCGLYNVDSNNTSYLIGEEYYYVDRSNEEFTITKQNIFTGFTDQIILKQVDDKYILDYFQINPSNYMTVNFSYDVTNYKSVINTYFSLKERMPQVISLEAQYRFLKYFTRSVKAEYKQINDYFYSKTTYKMKDLFRIALSYASKEELYELVKDNGFNIKIPSSLLNMANGNGPDDITNGLVDAYYDYNKINRKELTKNR